MFVYTCEFTGIMETWFATIYAKNIKSAAALLRAEIKRRDIHVRIKITAGMMDEFCYAGQFKKHCWPTSRVRIQ